MLYIRTYVHILKCDCIVCVGTVFPIIYGIVHAGMFGLLVTSYISNLANQCIMYIRTYVCLYTYVPM